MHASAVWINVLLGVLAGGACAAAFADDEEPDAPPARAVVLSASTGVPSSTSVSANANEAPRFDRVDMPADAQPSQPGYRNELSQLNYRWWASSGRADLGFGVGTVVYTARPTGSIPGLVADGSGTALAGGTVLTLGMRFRATSRASFFADASSLYGTRAEGDGVAGKVGLEFKSAQSRWNLSYGGFGMHLSGDTRMTVRLRRGGLALVMRSSF